MTDDLTWQSRKKVVYRKQFSSKMVGGRGSHCTTISRRSFLPWRIRKGGVRLSQEKKKKSEREHNGKKKEIKLLD